MAFAFYKDVNTGFMTHFRQNQILEKLYLKRGSWRLGNLYKVEKYSPQWSVFTPADTVVTYFCVK